MSRAAGLVLLLANSLTLACALVQGVSGSRAKPSPSTKTVIVVGSGASAHGLVHQLNLLRSDVRYVVLEGAGYVGGRTKTVSVGSAGATVDLGAQWFHGVDTHPWVPVAKQLGVELVMDFSEENVPPGSIQFLASQTGKQYPTSKFMTWINDFQKIVDVTNKWQHTTKQDEPLADALVKAQRVAASRMSHNSPLRHIPPGSLGLALYNWFSRWWFDEDYAAPATQLSLWWWNDDPPLPGGDALVPMGTGGFMLKAFPFPEPNTTVLLNHVVTHIDTSAPNKVSVYCEGVATPFVGDAVVVTASLGVMQSGQIQFTPELPASFATSLSHRGLGKVDKVVLEFATKWWPPLAWQFDYIDANASYSLIYDATHYTGGTPILIAFLTGDERVARYNGMPDSALVDALMAELRIMFPTASIPSQPVSSVVARWGTDPLFLGSWSYNRVGFDPKVDFTNIQQGATWRLQFAGEHTDPAFATIKGAWNSGLRAAASLNAHL